MAELPESPRVLIRADGGGRFGLGHVMRGLAMAEAFGDRGARVSFLMADILDCPAERVHSRGFGVEVVAPDVLEGGWTPGEPVDLLWVDHHEVTAPWLSRSREWSRYIGVIDDLADRHLDCDLVVSPAPRKGAEKHYRETVPSAKLLLGPRYAPLESRFGKQRPMNPRSGPPRRVVVSFGGADRKNQTCKALEGLAQVSDPLDLTVVVGGVNAHLKTVEAAADCSPHRVVVHVDVDDIATLLAGHDMAIGAAGDSAFERCCLGLPTVVVVCAENQVNVAEWLKNSGAALVLGWWQDIVAVDVAEAISKLCSDSEYFADVSSSAFSLVDGGGADQIMSEFDSIITFPLFSK
jgi:UDP-2,4-diacetamido-2,4,6-trideoxy-beta-L-altropyranose hydrolase